MTPEHCEVIRNAISGLPVCVTTFRWSDSLRILDVLGKIRGSLVCNGHISPLRVVKWVGTASILSKAQMRHSDGPGCKMEDDGTWTEPAEMES